MTRTSPISQQQQPSPPLPPPPILAPKPFGKTITEYRTFRRMGSGGEQTTSTTTMMRNDAVSSIDNEKRLSTNSVPSHEDLMESIRRFGGSQNLGKK
jgi:hypothetical protein